MSETPAAHTFTTGEGDDLITYDVRGDLGTAGDDRPVLFMFGSPMDAVGFGSLARHFTDRPVVTYDPRGAGRNPVGTDPITPEQHAADLHRVIRALGVGPVDCFASSGGAVNVLRMVEDHPNDVRRVVAHEPPTVMLLPDREVALGVVRDIRTTYQSSGDGPAMAKFISLVMFDGELPDRYLDQPAPDPAMFGMSADDDGTRTNPLMRNMVLCNEYSPQVDELRALGDRLVIAVGAESGQQMAARGGRSVAAALGSEAEVFPSNHGGFVGGEYGHPAGDPDGFAVKLHEVLDRQ
jgi:pimeloyl-ACP methyl ester carboxylesterase